MVSRREGADPENAYFGTGRWFGWTSRQQCGVRVGEHAASTRGFGLIESDDNERAVTMEIPMQREGARSFVPSLISEERSASVGKSERSVVPVKPGNAGGGKGPRYWESESMVNMPRHRADCAHDH